MLRSKSVLSELDRVGRNPQIKAFDFRKLVRLPFNHLNFNESYSLDVQRQTT